MPVYILGYVPGSYVYSICMHAGLCDWNIHVWFICIFVLSLYTWIVYCACWVQCNSIFIHMCLSLCQCMYIYGYICLGVCISSCWIKLLILIEGVFALLSAQLPAFRWVPNQYTLGSSNQPVVQLSSLWCLDIGSCVWARAWLTPRAPTV